MAAPSPFMQGDLKGVTQEEVSKLAKAMKDGQFRDHLDEYCKEVSDPANRKEYIQYLEQLEAKGEMPDGQQLLRTQPGCCAKTAIRFKNGQTQKLFINIVHTDRLADLSFQPAEKGGGKQVQLPYSLSPPRPDRDLKDQYCMTADCAVSSYTFFQASQNPQLLKMIVDTAAEGLAQQFLKGHEEVKKDFKVLERLKCKGGFPMPMSVRAELLKDKGTKSQASTVRAAQGDAVTPAELKQMRSDAKAKREAAKAAGEAADDAAAEPAPPPQAPPQGGAPRIRVPKHRLIHSGSIDLADYMENKNQQAPATSTVPKTLRLVVELPTVKKSSDVSLEVTCDNVVVEVADKFYLDLPLSYEVEDQNGTAKFDKAKQELTLELPVVPKPPVFRPEAALAEQAAMQEGGATGGAPDEDGGVSERGGESDDGEAPAPAAEDQPGGGDWIDRAAAAGLAAAAAPSAATPAATAPAERQRLELGEAASALRIATPAQEPPEEQSLAGAVGAAGGTAAGEAEEEAGEAEAEEDLPPFVPASSFDGARRGYYFSTGAEGLGYYFDRRQPRRARPAPPPPPAGPLVEEVLAPAAAANAAAPPPRPPLPPALQRYVAATAALGRRLEPSELAAPAGALGEPCAEARQNSQNVLVLIDLAGFREVADLQVAVKGHRLAVTFCARPAGGSEGGASASEGPRWQRQRLRRALGGAVDARQWHAELSGGGGAPLRLMLVLRKLRRGEPWPEVFDRTAEPMAQETEEAVPPPAAAAAPAPTPAGGVRAEDGSARAAAEAEAGEDAQDSAELDVAAPAAEGTPAPAAGPGAAAAAASVAALAGGAQLAATAAMVQSAAVMGQAVLLKNRLMYQLL